VNAQERLFGGNFGDGFGFGNGILGEVHKLITEVDALNRAGFQALLRHNNSKASTDFTEAAALDEEAAQLAASATRSRR